MYNFIAFLFRFAIYIYISQHLLHFSHENRAIKRRNWTSTIYVCAFSTNRSANRYRSSNVRSKVNECRLNILSLWKMKMTRTPFERFSFDSWFFFFFEKLYKRILNYKIQLCIIFRVEIKVEKSELIGGKNN